MHYRYLLFLFTFNAWILSAQDFDKLLEKGYPEGITVDLREPTYAEGVLTTDKGGVINGPDLRVQAQHIRYTRQAPHYTIEAEGNLILEFGEYVFVGEKLFYDFVKQEGIITCGRTQSGPWFFGGETIELRSDKSYVITNGYVTTSERDEPEWALLSSHATVWDEQYLQAKHVQLRFFDFPILWVPSLKANLDSIFDSPIRYRFKWGGRQGPRFGLTYEIFSWERWKTFIRFDYRITRGPGGGFETYYHSLDGKTQFQSINYVAKDSSLLDPDEKVRYRFEGVYEKELTEYRTNILMTYDKVSDIEMPGNYYDRDFDFETSERTQLLVDRHDDDWIASFYSRVRVNNFETVKQELPTIYFDSRPTVLGRSNIIVDHWARLSYLNFRYANNLENVHDFSSSRIEYRPTVYRSFLMGPINWTPELGGVSIFYGNSPKREEEKLLLQGKAGCTLSTQLYRHYTHFKHVIEPYTSYFYYSKPSVEPNEHYIFDIDDGWYQLNQLTVGVGNSFYRKEESCVSRPFYADIYSHAFFDSKNIKPVVPYLYGRFMFFFLPTLRELIETAWDFRHHQMAYFNIRVDWTYNADFALGTEYRHRNAYAWRKVDQENFFLEAFRSEKSLRHSPLSDRRDTLLFHMFYRFHPNWVAEISSRNGWDRLLEPHYAEYEINLLTTIQTAWHLKISFQHQEDDTRIAVYMNVGLPAPDTDECNKGPICRFE